MLVIGAGGAGLRAAIEASAEGAERRAWCASRCSARRTPSWPRAASPRRSGYVEPKDNWKVHFRDTMKGGRYLNQWRMAQLHAQEAPDRVKELEEWGALFDRTADGRILQRNFGGHKYPRLAHVGDRTGLEMIRTLQQHGIHCGMKVYMECTVTRLLVDGERVARRLRLLARERPLRRLPREVGRARDGRHRPRVHASTRTRGSARATGRRSRTSPGAELMDMEFMQFHPTGMVWPPSVRGTLITEGVRGEGGTLRNKDGKRIMFGYIPELYANETASTEEEADQLAQAREHLAADDVEGAKRTPDLLPRDIVARAIHSEVKAGRGSPHGGVFLDIHSRRTAEDIKRKLPAMYHQFKELGDVDITKEPMEVGPTAHYTMGGIRVDPETQQSRIKGLFAAGECAAGMHGANRLGGNSLSRLARLRAHRGPARGEVRARHAARPRSTTARSRTRRRRRSRRSIAKRGRTRSCSTRTSRTRCRRYVGIIRTEEDLTKGLEAARAPARRPRRA